MIPKVTNPLTKSIRTLEGWVLAVAAAVPWVVSLVDPSTLPHSVATKWSVVAAVALGISRSALKTVAVTQGLTGVAPEPVDLEALAAKVAAKIDVTKLPSTAQLKDVVNEGVKIAENPEGVFDQAAGQPVPATSVVAAVPSDATEAAAPPPVA